MSKTKSQRVSTPLCFGFEVEYLASNLLQYNNTLILTCVVPYAFCYEQAGKYTSALNFTISPDAVFFALTKPTCI